MSDANRLQPSRILGLTGSRKSGAKITVPAEVVNLRMPQTVIKFYEQHLK